MQHLCLCDPQIFAFIILIYSWFSQETSEHPQSGMCQSPLLVPSEWTFLEARFERKGFIKPHFSPLECQVPTQWSCYYIALLHVISLEHHGHMLALSRGNQLSWETAKEEQSSSKICLQMKPPVENWGPGPFCKKWLILVFRKYRDAVSFLHELSTEWCEFFLCLNFRQSLEDCIEPLAIQLTLDS